MGCLGNKNKIMENNFEQNIELDAQLVLAGMYGGIDGIMALGMRLRHIFPQANMVTDRCFWLKKQPEEYINKVSEEAAKMEKQKNKKR